MYPLLRPLLFRLDPETAHNLTIQLLRLAGIPPFDLLLAALFKAPEKPVQAFGIPFRNPVGLAAGYDKDGLAWRGLACLGFGHIELGTVTPLPQAGNPKPRVFRLVEDRALINRMGFPGLGGQHLERELIRARKRRIVLGVNLGKNKDTPLEAAAGDYTTLVRKFAPLADYLAINISSPNTPGLRRLQGREMLANLLAEIGRTRREMVSSLRRQVPILVKLAPDLTWQELEDALDSILAAGMDGIIATNTTLERPGLHSPLAGESGGLSGSPLREKSTVILDWLVRRLEGRLPVISVGGIMSAADARARLDAGAALVQVYTGLIFEGPGLVRNILVDLAKTAHNPPTTLNA
jgi:dihydroorotate dehydrogenase